jgi:hypothetical protein
MKYILAFILLRIIGEWLIMLKLARSDIFNVGVYGKERTRNIWKYNFKF